MAGDIAAWERYAAGEEDALAGVTRDEGAASALSRRPELCRALAERLRERRGGATSAGTLVVSDAFLLAGWSQAAVEVLADHVRAAPDDVVFEQLALLLTMEPHLAEAMEALEEHVARPAPDPVRARRALVAAIAWAAGDEVAEARRLVARARELDPDAISAAPPWVGLQLGPLAG